MRLFLPTMALVALATPVAFAQSAAQLSKDAAKAYGEKRFAQGAELYLRLFEKDPTETAAAYNAACCFGLAGDREGAFRCLEKALEAGFIDADGTAKDSDLEGLRGDARWPGLLARMRAKGARETAFWGSPALSSGYQAQLSEDERIGGLSKFWSEVKFNFINRDRLVELDWDALYLRYLPKVRAAKSTAEYYQLLSELCAQLKDGHTNVYGAPELRDQFQARPLLRTRLIEGRVLVTDVFDESLKAKGVAPGLEVLTVDGQPVKDYASTQLVPYQSASTPQDLETRVYTYAFLSGRITEAPMVGFKDAAGKTFSMAIPRVENAKRKQAMPAEAPFTFKMLPGGIAHVCLNSFGDDTAAKQYIAAFPEIAKAKALIFDVRNNGGGSSMVGYRVLATLTHQPIVTSAWSTHDYKPTFRAWGRVVGEYRGEPDVMPSDDAHHFSGPVIVLTSGATYSAAEDFSVAFDVMKRGLILGEPTGGSTGQPLMFKLPGGGSARVCSKRDTYPDGKAFVGVGVQPGKLVRPTVADFRAGKDTVLLAAQAEAMKALAGK